VVVAACTRMPAMVSLAHLSTCRLKGVKIFFWLASCRTAVLGVVRVATGMCIAYASIVCNCCDASA